MTIEVISARALVSHPKDRPSPYLVTWISRPLDSLIFLISAEEGGGVREDPLDIHFSLYPSRT